MPPQAEDVQADLYRFWIFLRQFRVLIAGFTLAAVVVATTYALVAKPKYRAEVVVSTVQVTDQQGGLGALASQLGGVASLVGMNFGGGAEKEQAIAVLKSRAFTEQLIRQRNLMPVLFEEDWDQEAKNWKMDSADDFPTMAEAYERFDRNIRTVREDSTTGLITLSIDLADRELAAELANLMIERLNDHLRQAAIDEANTNIEYLNEELSRSGALELRQAIFNLIQQQIELAMIANTKREFAFKVLDPAVPADADDHVWPLRAVIIAFGIVLGLLMGIAFALVLRAISRSRRDPGSTQLAN